MKDFLSIVPVSIWMIAVYIVVELVTHYWVVRSQANAKAQRWKEPQLAVAAISLTAVAVMVYGFVENLYLARLPAHFLSPANESISIEMERQILCSYVIKQNAFILKLRDIMQGTALVLAVAGLRTAYRCFLSGSSRCVKT